MTAGSTPARLADPARFARGRAFRLALGTASALGLARFAYGLLVPAMRSGLGWTLGQVGTQTTANGIGYLLGALIATSVARRIDPAATFRLGMVLLAAALAVSPVSGDFGFQLATRAIAGLAGALVFIAGGVIASRMAAQAGTATPIVVYFSGAGVAIALCGAVLPPFLSGHADRWPLAWAGLAVAAVLTTVISWTAARDGGAVDAKGTETERLDVRSVRKLWRLAIAYLLFGAGYITYITFLSAYLTSHHASVARIALTWALLGVAAIVAPALWSKPISTWPGRLALCALLALLAISSAAALASPSAPTVVGSAIVYGLTFLCVPAGVTALIRTTVSRTGWTGALAVFTVLFAVGQTGGPYLAGALADRYGAGATLAWTAVLCAAAAVSAITTGKRNSRAPDTEEVPALRRANEQSSPASATDTG
jgi:predicted MFS family arabinose efflux permease